MDKPTRNLIQKATQEARHLLETEFSRQLEGVFDILPDGTVAPEPGEHLDPAQKVVRRKIVAAIEHEKASGMSDREAVAAYLREASFTCLNRFTALKMLEARGLTLECVSRGEQSSGFNEFCGLGLKEAYRYLVRRPDEVFLSEFTADDRNLAEMGRLLQEGDEATFPEFTGPEDADRMIQLAYCVDGYLRHPFEDQVGDTWWPWWRKQRIEEGEPIGEVSTRDLMDILFAEVRADRHGGDGEMFEDPLTLKMANEVRRRVVESRREDLSREEMLRLPVFVPYRVKKDPRDIRVLDPVCGSGHFLLYAFDLLERIYEEAWADGGSSNRNGNGQRMSMD